MEYADGAESAVRRNDMTDEMTQDPVTEPCDEAFEDGDEAGLTDRERAYRKFNAFRADVLRCDWGDDKYMSSGSYGYGYITSDKCRRNIAPLLVKHGLEFIPVFSDLEYQPTYGNISNHWTVKLTARLIDLDTGYEMVSSAYGECGESGDKGVIKAQTCAIKQWILTTNLLADGVDVDAMDYGTGTYQRRTPEEETEVRSKVLDQGIKPRSKAEEPKTEAPKAEPKVVEPKAEMPSQEPETVTVQEPDMSAGFAFPESMSTMHRNAIKKILDAYEGDELVELQKEVMGITTKAGAVNFIKRHQTKVI